MDEKSTARTINGLPKGIRSKHISVQLHTEPKRGKHGLPPFFKNRVVIGAEKLTILPIFSVWIKKRPKFDKEEFIFRTHK